MSKFRGIESLPVKKPRADEARAAIEMNPGMDFATLKSVTGLSDRKLNRALDDLRAMGELPEHKRGTRGSYSLLEVTPPNSDEVTPPNAETDAEPWFGLASLAKKAGLGEPKATLLESDATRPANPPVCNTSSTPCIRMKRDVASLVRVKDQTLVYLAAVKANAFSNDSLDAVCNAVDAYQRYGSLTKNRRAFLLDWFFDRNWTEGDLLDWQERRGLWRDREDEPVPEICDQARLPYDRDIMPSGRKMTPAEIAARDAGKGDTEVMETRDHVTDLEDA